MLNESEHNLLQRITVEPGKRSGRPCIRGYRIAVHDVLGCLAGGWSNEEIFESYPELEPDDIKACLLFAAVREQRLESRPA